jgi:hypothetical protein
MGYSGTNSGRSLNVNVNIGLGSQQAPAVEPAEWASAKHLSPDNTAAPLQTSVPIPDVASIQSAVQEEFCSRPMTEQQKEISDFTEQSRSVLEPIYRMLNRLLAGGLLIGALWFWHVATPANGLYLVSILLFGLSFIVYAQYKEREEERQDTGPLEVLDNLSAAICAPRIEVKQPMVFALSSADLQTAAQMLQQGQDLDTVCRAVNSAYTGMPRLEQRLFRATLEAALKSSPHPA